MEKPKDEASGSDHNCADEISWKWERESLQGYSLTIGLSYRTKVLSDIEWVLTDVGGDKLLQQFVDGCFGHLLHFTGGSCNKALHQLMSREITLGGARENELWFRVGETNIRFAPEEYALVTGLHFGSPSFDPLESHELPREGVLNRLLWGQPIKIEELWKMFNEQRLGESPEDYLKVAHVLALNLMALGYHSKKKIERWVWVLVEDLDSWNKFPWGAYTYQVLMNHVSMLPKERRQVKRGYLFNGPAWALQIWAYEAIPLLGKICAVVTKEVNLPRCLNWSFRNGKKDLPKRFLGQKLACCVTLEPTDEEQRQPYWLSLKTQQPRLRHAQSDEISSGLVDSILEKLIPLMNQKIEEFVLARESIRHPSRAGLADPSSSKTTEKKKNNKSSRRQCPSSDEKTSESSSGDERRRRIKRGKKKQSDARESERCDCSSLPCRRPFLHLIDSLFRDMHD